MACRSQARAASSSIAAAAPLTRSSFAVLASVHMRCNISSRRLCLAASFSASRKRRSVRELIHSGTRASGASSASQGSTATSSHTDRAMLSTPATAADRPSASCAREREPRRSRKMRSRCSGCSRCATPGRPATRPRISSLTRMSTRRTSSSMRLCRIVRPAVDAV
ncbi:hypothetical protein [Nonomuraea turcica]|uniref:hypothetical protein n=1 Tax=Nonomuraea sp. G32 TaxID=3067274 RepID=UPI00273B0A10|nr:hypothetical protein [Nonomuraea sp. G32]MDP4502155.1 hypothetical protein [Nonomuraea sp. G32]